MKDFGQIQEKESLNIHAEVLGPFYGEDDTERHSYLFRSWCYILFIKSVLT